MLYYKKARYEVANRERLRLFSEVSLLYDERFNHIPAHTTEAQRRNLRKPDRRHHRPPLPPFNSRTNREQ